MASGPPADDATLVTRTLAGDGDAFRGLVERYQRGVFGIVLQLVRERAPAEDLSQEAFLKAYRALDSFDRGRRFSSWLFKIAHNTAIDHLRRREPEALPLENPEPEGMDLLDTLAAPAHQTPEARARRRRLAAALEEAMGRLKPDYRLVMELRFRQGLSYEEIAEVTGLPLGTVKTHLHRARKGLARALAELGWGPEDG